MPRLFIEDLFIVDSESDPNQPKIYRLREEVWKNLSSRVKEVQTEDPVVATALPLIRNEVIIASVPDRGDARGYYFVNLTALAINKD